MSSNSDDTPIDRKRCLLEVLTEEQRDETVKEVRGGMRRGGMRGGRTAGRMCAQAFSSGRVVMSIKWSQPEQAHQQRPVDAARLAVQPRKQKEISTRSNE
jgi:hypothetical protein